MMNKPQDTYKIEVEIAKGELPDLISKLYGEFELPAIKTAGDKDRILIQHMKEIFENFRGEPFIFDLKQHISSQLAKGLLIRDRDIIDEELWHQEISMKAVNNAWLRKNIERIFQKYDHRENFPSTINYPLHEEFIKLLKLPYEPNFNVSAFLTKQECYGVELIEEFSKKINLNKIDIQDYAFHILQIDKLIIQKRVHKYLDKGKPKVDTGNVFLVRWFNNEVRLLHISRFGTENRMDYIVYPIIFKPEVNKGILKIIEGAKVYIKLPSLKL